MPPVKKPKAQKIEKQATPKKTIDKTKDVISGQLKKKVAKARPQKEKGPERGVIIVKHLPHGFFEQQLRQYFRQFGRVLRVRLARSLRTGNSKGYAFVEFEYPEVAKVAADTMDNYLMFQKVVKASYIPPEKQTFNYFRTSVKKVTNKAGKEIYISDLTKATQRSVKKQNNWDESACQKRTVANLNKIKKLQEKYKGLGIDFSNLLVEPVKKSKKTSETAETTEASTSKPAAGKKQKQTPKKDISLEDLLGNTINEDSDDEDYVDASDDESELEVDEEEEEEEDSDQASDDSDEEEELPPPPKKKNKASPTDKLKRKPGTGGIQKKKLAPAGKSIKNAATQKLQLAAAKSLAKPLPKGKAKKSKK
ncbi:MKI67 FHA domain-interacting nucleolar phosphoprotein [Drosophila eugracilis]|uniref:MKI67 FHA domain-interacting nucleolar phosphoprotein n=1 Tax=Drosophila eugracilis TaxID=29029 RepID=UPI0007E6B131|nr:MKI67 FHA domain-interacting nucleolar phosphoprotein [Drosophila eugracilis]